MASVNKNVKYFQDLYFKDRNYITVQEMNKLLEKEEEEESLFVNINQKGLKYNKYATYYEETEMYFDLWMFDNFVESDSRTRYSCRLDDRLDLCPITKPGQVYAVARRHYNKHNNLPDLRKGEVKDKITFTKKVAGILFRNPSYHKQWVDAVGYDMNSAYGWGACQDMPDTVTGIIGRNRFVNKGEIGFTLEGRLVLPRERTKADYIYKSISNTEENHPFVKFMNHYYNLKENSTGEERQRAKNYITYLVGFMENTNPALRAAAIGHVNRLLTRLIPDLHYDYDLECWVSNNPNILFGNTDSIVVRKETVLDVELGTKMGQWKIEKQGLFAHKGFNCQWKGQKAKIKGRSSVTIDETYDICSDKPYIYTFEYWCWNENKKRLVKEERTTCLR